MFAANAKSPVSFDPSRFVRTHHIAGTPNLWSLSYSPSFPTGSRCNDHTHFAFPNLPPRRRDKRNMRRWERALPHDAEHTEGPAVPVALVSDPDRAGESRLIGYFPHSATSIGKGPDEEPVGYLGVVRPERKTRRSEIHAEFDLEEDFASSFGAVDPRGVVGSRDGPEVVAEGLVWL